MTAKMRRTRNKVSLLLATNLDRLDRMEGAPVHIFL
jgi:hypothetical protein